jgi:CheY-like chemotaxis protein
MRDQQIGSDPEPRETEQHPLRSPARRVLLVEDERDVREMLQMLLELAGHEVFGAASGAEAIAAFRQHKPDVAFIDFGLPGMDGFQLVRALRQEPHGREACLVALSGYTQPEDRRRAVEAGFDLHLAKPACLEDLEKVLSATRPTALGRG